MIYLSISLIHLHRNDSAKVSTTPFLLGFHQTPNKRFMYLNIHCFHFTVSNSLPSRSKQLDCSLFKWLFFYTPSFVTTLSFLSEIHPTAYHLKCPFVDFHHYYLHPHKENILSEYLHNHDLPLDKTSFPSSLWLFFATGNIEPP